MYLEGGTRDHFMRWLEAEHPELVDGYQQLYAGKYAPTAYRDEVTKSARRAQDEVRDLVRERALKRRSTQV